MIAESRVNQTTLRLLKDDITALEVEAFVYYAKHDLALGSGFGTAIAIRGGPSVAEELKKFGAVGTTDVVLTKAGTMKAQYIIHAVGPRFQEEDLEKKLRETILRCLRVADEHDIRQVAFPPMGAGFYGVPLDVCARVMVDTIGPYLKGKTGLREVLIVGLDTREVNGFKAHFQAAATA